MGVTWSLSSGSLHSGALLPGPAAFTTGSGLFMPAGPPGGSRSPSLTWLWGRRALWTVNGAACPVSELTVPLGFPGGEFLLRLCGLHALVSGWSSSQAQLAQFPRGRVGLAPSPRHPPLPSRVAIASGLARPRCTGPERRPPPLLHTGPGSVDLITPVLTTRWVSSHFLHKQQLLPSARLRRAAGEG